MSEGQTSRILVVDDDPLVARTLGDLLKHHGFDSVRSSSGEQALEMLRHDSYDLVMLDVRLPGIDGFETCARIRDAHGPSLPVIMVTAFGDPRAIRRGHEVGADDFLHKPVDTLSLVLKVRAFLRFKSLHDEMVRAREEAQARARDLAQLHEIGRDWSLIAEPEHFHRMVTQRLASLIGASICLIALYDPATRVMAAALPVHGMSDESARRLRYRMKPEYRALWNFRTGRPYVSNRARTDSRLISEIVQAAEADSVVLVPMLAERTVLGLLVAANKPGGFTDRDVQLLSIFAGPAASFLRGRQVFIQQRRHAGRVERVSALVGEMATITGRAALLQLTVSRVQQDLGFERVAFYAPEEDGGQRLEAEAGSADVPAAGTDRELLKWAGRGAKPLPGGDGSAAELAVPVRAGDESLGVLHLVRPPGSAFSEDEVNLLTAVGGHLAIALQRSASSLQTERLAAQMATLYDLGLETAALRDLRSLFVKATEEAGRLIKADHTSVFRLHESEGTLRVFAGWANAPTARSSSYPVIRLGEGIASRVARERVPMMVNDPERYPEFVRWEKPVARLLCVPLTYYDQEREAPAVFGVLNATRQPGGAPFTNDDLEYLTRFASQLGIAVANSMAFAAERERSDQLALVNALIREIAGNLSRERILETAVRRIHEAFPYPVVMIVVPDFEAGLNRIVHNASAQPRPQARTYPISAGITARVLRDKRTVLAEDVLEEPEYLPMFPSTRSELMIPILSGEDVVAVLNIESNVPRAFNRGQVITLETLADGLGIILRNAELYHILEQTNSKLVELDRTKSELVNLVAHDFRAPLAGVLGYAELLQWKPEAPEPERVEHAGAIIQAATRMASLVDKTLKTTRLETGHFPFDFGLVDLAAIVREAARRHPADESHPLVVEAPEDPVPCWADADRVSEVLENLLSNAVKYSPSGGEVRLGLAADADTATITVRDQGVGIEPRDTERLFRPFSRVRDRRTAEIEGSGLGLYISERIARAHGGRLWVVESSPGTGSVFGLALPLFGVAAQTRAPLVLVAAGDERTRREVRRVAEGLGYGTHEVADGVDAVEAAVRLSPVAVVVDRVLPRLGAEEVAERLRENGATAAVPIFALTAEQDLGAKAGLFTGCVPKPLDRSVLAAALDAVSRGTRLV
jgi:signal transduction histidine kinase/DNA-binding response OmpR family regulator